MSGASKSKAATSRCTCILWCVERCDGVEDQQRVSADNQRTFCLRSAVATRILDSDMWFLIYVVYIVLHKPALTMVCWAGYLRSKQARELLLEVGYAGAFAEIGRQNDHYIPPGDAQLELVKHQLLKPGSADGFWTLAEKAASLVVQSSSLQSPSKLLMIVRDVPLDSMSALELVASLGNNGWLDKLSERSRTKTLKPYTTGPDSAKVWYRVRDDDTRISKPYLKCLLLADDIFKAGLTTELHHCQLESLLGKQQSRLCFSCLLQEAVYSTILNIQHTKQNSCRYYLCILHCLADSSMHSTANILPNMPHKFYLELMGKLPALALACWH